MKLLLLFLLFHLMSPFTSFAEKTPEKITWIGCGISKNSFAKPIAAAFEKKTGVKVEIRGGGAFKGIRKSSSGTADVGGTCRCTLDVPEEANAILHHVAWDALVAIVPTSNPLNNLTSDQLHDIVMGKVTNWKELGGADMAIDFYARRGTVSGVGYMFRVQFMKNPDLTYPRAIEVPRSSGLVEMLVRKGGGTFGLSGASSAHKRKNLKMLSLDGVYPSKKNIQSGQYKLIRPLYWSTHKKASSRTKELIDFIRSPEGQDIIAQEGCVNLQEGKDLSQIFKDRFGEKYLAPDAKSP